MSNAPVAFLLFCLVSSVYALRCHEVTTPASLDQPIHTEPIECFPNAVTCSKIINIAQRTYTKACSMSGCTNEKYETVGAVCTNSTQFGGVTMNCCCYDDGCNSAPMSSLLFAGVTIFLVHLAC